MTQSFADSLPQGTVVLLPKEMAKSRLNRLSQSLTTKPLMGG